MNTELDLVLIYETCTDTRYVNIYYKYGRCKKSMCIYDNPFSYNPYKKRTNQIIGNI